jgi:hypothetical protein
VRDDDERTCARYARSIELLDTKFTLGARKREYGVYDPILTVHLRQLVKYFTAQQALLPKHKRRRFSKYLTGLARAFRAAEKVSGVGPSRMT